MEQYVIIAKHTFKTSIDALQIMLSNLKKYTTFLSADLTALWPTVRLLAVGVWTIISHNDAGDCCLNHNYEIFVLSAIACLLILHSTDCDVELVTANQQMPAGISHKNIFFETQDESPQNISILNSS